MRYPLILLVASLMGSGSRAATITVNTAVDELNSNGNCSLREAIQAANTDAAVDACTAGGGPDTIRFIPALAGQTITMTLGQFVISSPLTLFGDPALGLTLQPSSGGIFQVSATGILSLQDLTLQGSSGAIFNGGSLVLARVKFLNNHAVGEMGRWGCIYPGLTVPNSPEVAIYGPPGGDSAGAAIYNAGGTILASQCIFANNSSQGGQGGYCDFISGNGGNGRGTIYISGGRVQISQSLFSGNHVQGGMAGTCGGGPSSGDGGSALGGSIVNDGGSLDIINCTFSGDFATGGSGGGLSCSAMGLGGSALGSALYTLRGQTSVKLSTFSGASLVPGTGAPGGTAAGGAIYIATANAFASLSNSIMANTAGGLDAVNNGGIVTGSLNLIRTSSNIPPGVISLTSDPALAALANNGGPTQTLALFSGSPAINTGNCAGGTIFVDQRGRPRPIGPACDLGAYEYNPAEGAPGDSDGDGVPNALDCAPLDPNLWAAPAIPVLTLRVTQQLPGGAATALGWLTPPATGASSPAFDVLRSTAAGDFSAATCVVSNGAATTASDFTAASAFYLVRVKNGCGSKLAPGSSGLPVNAASCP